MTAPQPVFGGSVEAETNLLALLRTAIDGPPGTRYSCGHQYAQVTLVGGALPAVAVYAHTLTSPEPPRLIDFRTAQMLTNLLGRHYDLEETRTEPFDGTLADWRVTHESVTEDNADE